MNTTIAGMKLLVACLLLRAAALAAPDENFFWPGHAIGPATTTKSFVEEKHVDLMLSNGMFSATFRHVQTRFSLVALQSRPNRETLLWTDSNLFTLHLKGRLLPSSAMRLIKAPEFIDLAPAPEQVNLASRSPGKAITATFRDDATGITVYWSAILRDESNYLRQHIAVTSANAVEILDIEMINTALSGAKAMGYTDGSPIVCGNWFLGLEHPMAKNAVHNTAGWTPVEMAANQISMPINSLKPGPCTVKFAYTSGNHGINIKKVALVADGKTLVEDAHPGFSGHATRRNEYTLQIPIGVSGGNLLATLANEPGQYNGYGDITTSNGSLAPGNVTAALPRGFTLAPGDSWTLSTAIGIAPAGQLRRAFAYYLQRERAHPYRQYWHYNSWYDLNINRNDLDDPLKRMNEAQCLEVINDFDKNLHQKYGIGLNGFVWDDGWDDWNTLWGFHKGFPNGFSKLSAAASAQGAKMGAWLSPWGGYGRSHNMRVTFGKQHGYETNPSGFSLGGTKYRAAFRDACLKMIRDYQQNYFKFDGIGTGSWAIGAPASISADLDGLVSVTRDLRLANPSVFINCTVGTWASPYWTFFADSIWRQGEDTSFAGKGNPRERWINYKDGIVYRRFASASPLFPLNSLMYHGLVLGPVANPAKMPTPAQNLDSFRHEIQMMAAYASGLGELYITPSLMNDEAWSMLAECIGWARSNQRLLADTHWIGGNPEKNEIYGLAAWHPVHGGVITLRNPDDKPQSITLDLAKVWELPASVSGEVELRTPWNSAVDRPAIHAVLNVPLTLTLQPFDVVNLQSPGVQHKNR